MVQRILDDTEETILADERRSLIGLQSILSDIKATAQDQATLAHSLSQLGELFSLVIVGEFNSGKSAVANALLSRSVLEEGVTPTTTRIQVLKYGPGETRTELDGDVAIITAPLDILRVISVVDTPGTNAIHRHHETITRQYVPRSDVILFVTSADRPFTESERLFLEAVRAWGKKVVFALNKIDILESEEEVARIMAFIAENATAVLGVRPEVFPVSARQALRAKESGDASMLAASRFSALENFIVTTLDDRERLRLKLLSPLGVARNLVQTYKQKTESHLEALNRDLTAIADIEWKLTIFKEDMARQLRFRLADVDNAWLELERRSVEFVDETMRLTRLFAVADAAAMQSRYEHRALAGSSALVAERAIEMVEWIVASEQRQRQAVLEYLSQRRLQHVGTAVSRLTDGQQPDGTRIREGVEHAVNDVFASLDATTRSGAWAASLRGAAAWTVGVEAGAVALGAGVVALASAPAVDMAGAVAACVVAAAGLLIIPSRRRAANHRLRARLTAMREECALALSRQMEEETSRSVRRITEAIAPYVSMVRAESGYWTTPRDALTSTGRMLIRLQARVEAL